MRNGNCRERRQAYFLFLLRSYPTYEEWKQDCNILDIYCFDSSYPTYEEWKLKNVTYGNTLLQKSSYPTYEEWKQYRSLHTFKKVSLFLSYL